MIPQPPHQMLAMPTRARSYADPETRWRALCRRDRRADGHFVYAVTSTGVFCRPGCASRRPLRENVQFFDASEQAERAGYRACKRCAPGTTPVRDATSRAIVKACRLLEGETVGRSDEVARELGLS